MKAKCPTTNAENWWYDTKFDKRILPELGDIGVYHCGKKHYAKDSFCRNGFKRVHDIMYER